jgi:hypothetical protein
MPKEASDECFKLLARAPLGLPRQGCEAWACIALVFPPLKHSGPSTISGRGGLLQPTFSKRSCDGHVKVLNHPLRTDAHDIENSSCIWC